MGETKEIKLHPGESEIKSKETGELICVSTSREWTAETLKKVADYSSFGAFPNDVTAFDLGRAIGRALHSCEERCCYDQVLKGLDHWIKNASRVSQ